MTSLSAGELKKIGLKKSPQRCVRDLALLAKSARLDGVVCSVHEISTVRKYCGDRFVIVTPGIRPQEAKRQDQRRTATPEQAFSLGTNYIVVGRPITKSKNPIASAKAIINTISSLK